MKCLHTKFKDVYDVDFIGRKRPWTKSSLATHSPQNCVLAKKYFAAKLSTMKLPFCFDLISQIFFCWNYQFININ